jgi:PAS domain S-box-containing protein
VAIGGGERLQVEEVAGAAALAAIYELADAVARADTVDAVFAAALDALERGIGIDRAAVVLFDAAGGIEFRAWRGLSETYRERVRGRRPWPERIADRTPFVVDDVLADDDVADLHDAFGDERIRSMALVPLVHGGAVLGRFVLYSSRPSAFAAADVQLAEAMASHVAAAADRRRTEAAVRESRTQLEAIVRGVADGITVQAADGSLVFANEAGARFAGYESLEEFVSTPIATITSRFELFDEDGAPLTTAELPGRIALAEGRESERVIQYRIRATGERRWSLVRATPVFDQDGIVRLAVNIVQDLTPQRRTEERLRVLADAGRTLSSSLAVDETLAEIARLVVPTVADYCLVDLLAEDGSLRHVVHVHVDPEGERTLDEIRRRYPVLENPAHPVARVVASREPHLQAEQPEEALDAIALDDPHRELYRRLAPLSFLAVPLVARGRTLGALSLGTTADSGRRLDADDLGLAVELAERAALAVDNALLYEESQDEVEERLRTEARLRAIGRVSEVLAASLDYEETLRTVAGLVVPGFADWCIVYERRPDGSIRRLAIEHAGGQAERVREVLDRYPLDPDADHGVPLVLRTGVAELVEDETAERLTRDVSDPDGLMRELEDIAPRSSIRVPLVARGRTVGAISLLAAESGRTYGPDDLAFASEVARRAAVAIDRARLYSEATESLALLDALFSTAPTGVAFFDADLRYVRVNDAMAELNGVPPEEHVGRTVQEVLPELDPRVHEALRRVAETGEPLRGEATATTPAHPAEPRTWLIDYYPVVTVEGRAVGLGAVVLDITERKRAEARLRESEERFRTLADTIPALVWMTDADNACTYFNRIWLEFTGRPLEEQLGDGWADSVHPDDREAALRIDQAAFDARRPVTLEYRMRRHDGVYRWVLDEGVPRFEADGTFAGFIGASVDIDDRKQAETRERLLTEASTLLASSLDIESTLDSVAALVVPRLADRCSIVLVEPDGSLRTVAAASSGREPTSDPDDERAAAAVVRTGEPVPPRGATDERASLAVPLVARERPIGALTLATSNESGRRLGSQELALAHEIARRAAVAVDNAWLFDEHRQAERRLREAQTRLRSAVDAAAIGTWVWDIPADSVVADEFLARLFAVDSERAAAGIPFAEFARSVHPDDRARVEAAVSGAVEHGKEYDLEYRVVDAAGEVHWLLARGRVEYDIDGRPARFPGAVSEITKEKLAAERLELLRKASEALGETLEYDETLRRLTTLVVPALADFCFVDLRDGEGRIERVARRHADPAVQTALDDGTLDVPSPDLDVTPVADVLRTGVPQLTVADETLDDVELMRRLHVTSALCVPLLRGREAFGALTLCYAGSGRRYTDEDVALAQELAVRAAIAVENALLHAETEQRAQAAQALEFVGDGVFLVDATGVVRLWNPAAARITHLTAAEVVGRPVSEVLADWPLEQLGERQQTYPVDAAGRELWLSLTAVPFDEGVVYAFRDLTEESAVERLKSDFVSTVSHELRTPLAAIYGAAMTLQRTDVALADDQRSGLLAVVAGESERLARTVNDVLWASRLDSGVLDVSIESCDAGALVTAVVAAARIHLPAPIDLALEVEPGTPPVAADPDKVRQVLVNLVDNAIKYSPDGGLVEVSVGTAEQAVRFAVSDRGLGIPASEHGRIFEKFFRLDPNLTRGVGGTGLGLYICRELVRRMDGRIGVESSEGAGSTFWFELPTA